MPIVVFADVNQTKYVKGSTPGLSDDDRIAIRGGTAAKLLGID
jgi:hypothetical protein